MKVTLNWITPDAEARIAKMARVSNPKNEDNPNYTRLIEYLIEHRHWSPFEMCNMCVEIETTRAISAQILRHRSFSFQEFSQRYADASGMSFDLPELRDQDSKNRQNSLPTKLSESEKVKFEDEMANIMNKAFDLYEELVEAGVAKEVARGILPMNTQTRIHMSGTMRSWIHYLQVRCERGTQKEHRDVADAIALLIKDHLPAIFEATKLGDLIE